MTAAAPRVIRVWTTEDLLTRPDPEWQVEGMIPNAGDGLIYGATGTGKTFVVLDLALTIASGIPTWFGRKVKQTPVVYVAGEGSWGLKFRIAAWQRMHPDATAPLLIVPDGIQLMSVEDTAALIAAIDATVGEYGVGVVIFDTLARATPGGNENDRQDMGLALESAADIRRKFGCSVWLIHHSGHDASRPRGTTSLLQAVDWSIRFEMSDGNRVMKCDKQRDGPPFEPIGFRLTPFAPSLIVEPVEFAQQPAKGRTPNEQRVIEAFRGQTGPLSFTLLHTATDLPKTSFRKALNSLEERGEVSKGDLGYSLKDEEGPGAKEGPNGATAPRVGGARGARYEVAALGPNPGPDDEPEPGDAWEEAG